MSHRLSKSAVSAAISAAIALMAMPAHAAPAKKAELIPNQYIVVLDKAALPTSLAKLGLNDLVQSTLVQVGGGVVLHKYGTALTGFSARISANQAAALAQLPYVKSVEQDQLMKASATQTGAT